MATLLEMAGHAVQVAYAGPAALEAAAAFRPDVVLLDIGLPGSTATRSPSACARTPPWRASTLIAVSGYGQEEDRRRSMEAGFDRHLVKPVDFKELQDLLAMVARRGVEKG